ncbi:MAG TPA: hypothetical protein HPP79_13875 [Gammaproteobacteria bacterium]|nr:hypothetical protein [Gammaproteobacteria bacterium]
MPVDKAYAIPDDAIPSIDEEEVELEDNLVAQDGDVEIVEDDDGGVTVDFAREDVDAGNLEHFDNLQWTSHRVRMWMLVILSTSTTSRR